MSDTQKDILEWIYCIIIALVIALVFRYFVGTPTVVKQRSMFPTLKENERLILNRTFRITKHYPTKGDIITFEAPDKDSNIGEVDQSNPVAKYSDKKMNLFQKFVYSGLEITKTSYIKRLIAEPGDHVEIKDSKVYINGELLVEDYLQPDVKTESTAFNDFIVPEGYVFAIGDNREKSTDCRRFGCIPYDKIEGIVVFRFWPLNMFGRIK